METRKRNTKVRPLADFPGPPIVQLKNFEKKLCSLNTFLDHFLWIKGSNAFLKMQKLIFAAKNHLEKAVYLKNLCNYNIKEASKILVYQ